ncbi:3'-5' exoribonuclease 1-like [Amphiura filiformis]|uniref:3'-5' exoribonuclease 1-like n=1 Tax=Amphiura filiformis TaxID=82378 RepID=UPI003B223749
MTDIILVTVTALVGLGTVIFLILNFSRRRTMASASHELQNVAKRMKCSADSSPDRMKQCSPPRHLETEELPCSSGDGPSASGLASSKRETHPNAYKEDKDEKKNFKHGVFKKISRKNGEINQLSKQKIKVMLSELKLDQRGSGDVVKARLKNHFKNQLLGEAGMETTCTQRRYDYICVIDFEATCDEPSPPDYLQEIIEFPVVLLNTHTLEIEESFTHFCKPVINPKLSDFCKVLTSITQAQVDHADTFPVVLNKVKEWMDSKGLGTTHTFAVAADGPWDMNYFLNIQCELSEIPFPEYAKRWVNLSKAFSNFYKTHRMNLLSMLTTLELSFKGRQHRGIDDAKNIARIAIQLLQDGCDLQVNESLQQD